MKSNDIENKNEICYELGLLACILNLSAEQAYSHDDMKKRFLKLYLKFNKLVGSLNIKINFPEDCEEIQRILKYIEFVKNKINSNFSENNIYFELGYLIKYVDSLLIVKPVKLVEFEKTANLIKTKLEKLKIDTAKLKGLINNQNSNSNNDIPKKWGVFEQDLEQQLFSIKSSKEDVKRLSTNSNSIYNGSKKIKDKKTKKEKTEIKQKEMKKTETEQSKKEKNMNMKKTKKASKNRNSERTGCFL